MIIDGERMRSMYPLVQQEDKQEAAQKQEIKETYLNNTSILLQNKKELKPKNAECLDVELSQTSTPLNFTLV